MTEVVAEFDIKCRFEHLLGQARQQPRPDQSARHLARAAATSRSASADRSGDANPSLLWESGNANPST